MQAKRSLLPTYWSVEVKKINWQPSTPREMLDCGMISYQTFKQVKEMDISDAKRYCDNEGLYQTWTYHFDAIVSHIDDNNLLLPVDRTEFVRELLKMCDGKVNPYVLNMVYGYYHQ